MKPDCWVVSIVVHYCTAGVLLLEEPLHYVCFAEQLRIFASESEKDK